MPITAPYLLLLACQIAHQAEIQAEHNLWSVTCSAIQQ